MTLESYPQGLMIQSAHTGFNLPVSHMGNSNDLQADQLKGINYSIMTNYSP